MKNSQFKYSSSNGHLSQRTIDWIKDLNGKIVDVQTKNLKYLYHGLNPEFWKRLKQDNIQTINIDGKPSSHLLSYGIIEEDGKQKYIIYPLIHQDDNGKLYYNSDINHALQKNNFVYAPDEEIAKIFTEHYKEAEAFKGFRQFNPIKNQLYWNAVQDNFPKIKLIYQTLQKRGYSPEQIAGAIGNLVVESQLDEFKTEGNGGHGYGLVQWTDNTRKNNLNNYSTNLYKSEFERQLEFMVNEMQNKKVWNQAKLNKTKFEQQKVPYKSVSVTDATKTFMNGFENPNKEANHYDDRLEVANYILSPGFQSKLKTDLVDYNSSIINPSYKTGGQLNYYKFFK